MRDIFVFDFDGVIVDSVSALKHIYYDFVFVDIWHDPSDGIDLYLKFKSLEKKNIKYSYWIEDTIKCYIE